MPRRPSGDQRVSVRIPARCANLKDRLAKAAETSGVDESVIVIAAIKGACDFIEEHGEIMLPITVAPRLINEMIARLERLAKGLHGETLDALKKSKRI